MDINFTLILCGIVAFVASALSYKLLLPRFVAFNLNQTVSEYALDEFKNKQITPTLGGLVFISVTVVLGIVYNIQYGLSNPNIWLLLIALVGYGIIGFIDDYKIVKEGKNSGISATQKLVGQFLLAAIFTIIYQQFGSTTLKIPFIEQPIELGWFYFIVALFMFAGTSNAVNLTDGMDGLSSGTSMIAIIPFIVIALRQNKPEVAIILAVLFGALGGYLLFNKKPAKIYMGDTGSLAIGGFFAATAMVLKSELLLILIGLVFVIETLSVIIQRLYYKKTKKRLFPYTPIHYSFTKKGVSEEKTVLIFYIFGALFALIAILVS